MADPCIVQPVLFFVAAETVYCEDVTSMNLFVSATTPLAAFVHWKRHYDGWGMPEDVRVFGPIVATQHEQAIKWDSIPVTTYTM